MAGELSSVACCQGPLWERVGHGTQRQWEQQHRESRWPLLWLVFQFPLLAGPVPLSSDPNTIWQRQPSLWKWGTSFCLDHRGGKKPCSQLHGLKMLQASIQVIQHPANPKWLWIRPRPKDREMSEMRPPGLCWVLALWRAGRSGSNFIRSL